MAASYWERSTPNDPRITIEPEIPVELTADDYFAGAIRCSRRSSPRDEFGLTTPGAMHRIAILAG